jgi:hypothetical protein
VIVDLDDARAYIGKPSGETEQDPTIVALILRTGEAINRFTARRFDLEGAPATRLFAVNRYDQDARTVLIDDLSAAPSAALILNEDGTTLHTLIPATDLQMLPLNRQAWQPIDRIRFRPAATAYPSSGAQLSITGYWGFPSVPEDVKQAALMQVRTWWRRDVANTSTGSIYAPEPQDLERPFGLGNEVMRMLKPYTRMGIA